MSPLYEQLWSTMTHYDPLWPTMTHYDPLWSTWRTMLNYDPLCSTMIHYDPLWSTWRTMLNYDPLCSTMIHYDPVWSTWRTMTHYDPHDELWSTMTHMTNYDPLWPASGNSLQLGKTWIWYILKIFLCLFDLSSFTKESLIITAQIICCTSSVPRRTNSDIGIEKSRNLQAWTRVQQ